MRKRLLSATILIGALLLPLVVRGQDAENESDAAKQQELFEQFAKPGKEHQQLRRLVGNWTANVKYYFDESGKPTASNATAVIRPMMGGRYIQQRFNGEMQGQKFSGMGISSVSSRLASLPDQPVR